VKIAIAVLLVVAVMLQWRFWFGDGSVREVLHQQRELRALTETLTDQQDKNKVLRAEVNDLGTGYGEIEERARSELGMIGKDETFYQFVGERDRQVDKNIAQVPVIEPVQ